MKSPAALGTALGTTLALAVASTVFAVPAGATPTLPDDKFPGCSWWVETTATTSNVAFPDTGATYWTTPFLAQEGMSILVNGTYPQTRFMSFTVYNNAGGNFTTNGVSSQIDDYAINPDQGSQNPWQTPGAPAGGNYAVTLSPNAEPTDANTVPILPPNPQPTAQGLPASLGFLIMRVYLPTGGPSAVDLPTLTVVSASGARSVLAACNKKTRPIVQAAKAGIKVMSAFKRLANPPSPPCGATCPEPLSFFRASAATTNAFFPNSANAYASMLFTPKARSVVVIRLQVPTSPTNVGGGFAPVPWTSTGNPDYDLRYWSVCNNVYTAPYPVVANKQPKGGTTYGCVADNAAITTVSAGVTTATIVISSPVDRPANATVANGYNWLPTSVLYPKAMEMVALRNMLTSDDFHYAVQDVPSATSTATPAQTAAVMGFYYPQVATCAAAVFATGGAEARLR